MTDETGALERIVEFAEAETDERAISYCNSGILAAGAHALFEPLPKIENDNAKDEYYLTDIVARARAAGLRVLTEEDGPLEVADVNSPEELALPETCLAAVGWDDS